MRFTVIALFCCLLLSCSSAYAMPDKKKKDQGPPKTEAELVDKLLDCVKFKDTLSFNQLFAGFDTVWKLVTRYRDSDATAMQEVNELRQHPDKIQQFDPEYNPDITKAFYYVLRKEDDSDVHFDHLILTRFEFRKQILTRDLVGFEYIAPLRYQGYIFAKDELTRITYCISVTEIQEINNRWYAGQIVNMLPAENVDDYLLKAAAEKKVIDRMIALGIPLLAPVDTSEKKHSITTDNPDEEKEDKKVIKEIVDRRFYEGKFDNEITVRLYVQFIKGGCPEKICSWEAIYRVGEQTLFTHLLVSKTSDSTWSFEEDPPESSMELTLKNKIFKGTWIKGDDETGYDVYMTQKDILPERVKRLDNIIENKLWAKPGEDKEKPKEMETEKNNDEGY